MAHWIENATREAFVAAAEGKGHFVQTPYPQKW
jgi:hypothetical protein